MHVLKLFLLSKICNSFKLHNLLLQHVSNWSLTIFFFFLCIVLQVAITIILGMLCITNIVTPFGSPCGVLHMCVHIIIHMVSRFVGLINPKEIHLLDVRLARSNIVVLENVFTFLITQVFMSLLCKIQVVHLIPLQFFLLEIHFTHSLFCWHVLQVL